MSFKETLKKRQERKNESSSIDFDKLTKVRVDDMLGTEHTWQDFVEFRTEKYGDALAVKFDDEYFFYAPSVIADFFRGLSSEDRAEFRSEGMKAVIFKVDGKKNGRQYFDFEPAGE